ncbi:hypothetical protein RRG08_066181 [Elysia crispata]|uniref:Cyclic nucleotide-binding domain-containing protein n=1 Tax=Elysia crispata TaxID=231223 RepID=A0AAE0YL55_9GAST|nr:hypothetical protein RRG08_066181 [Elysia crispata]
MVEPTKTSSAKQIAGSPSTHWPHHLHDDDYYLVAVQWDMLYRTSIFIIGAMVRHFTNILDIPLPYTVIVFFVGMVVGCLPINPALEINPHVLLLIFLPILIFDGAFAIDTYIFNKIILQVLVLAFPAMVLMTALLAGTAMYVFKYAGWTWTIALLFGAVLSATDPVAVVAIMKDLGAGKRLALLIEGESMLNDGSAIVLYEILWDIIGGHEHSATDIFLHVLRVAGGGPLFGYLVAQVDIFLLQWTFNDSLAEIAITITSAYLVFILADHILHVSAVLAVVMLGVTLSNNKTSISPEVEVCLHSFWEALAFMANTCIFSICGTTVTRRVLFEAEPQDYIYIIFLYFATQVVRALAFMIFAPVLRRLGYGMTWQDGLVCTWSGLRGAVGLALALIIFKSELPALQLPTVGNKILFHVALIVVGTLLINATTVSNLLQFLGHTEIKPAQRSAMKKAIAILTESRRKTMSVWKIDRFLTDADWDMVLINSTIDDPFMSTETEADLELMDRKGGICPSCLIRVRYEPTTSEIRAMKAEATRKYLKLFKQNLWIQFEHGLLSGYSARKLNELAEEAADVDLKLIHVSEIKAMGQIPRSLAFTKYIIIKQTVTFPHDDLRMFTKVDDIYCKGALWMTSQSIYLLLGLYGMDSLLILISLTLTLSQILPVSSSLFEGTNALMIGLMTIFFLFRWMVFGVRYLYTVWYLINTVSLGVGYLELLVTSLEDGEGPNSSAVVKALYYMRLFRLVQLLEVLVHIFMYLINMRIRAQLTTACDMARGFVRATEMAMPLIEHVSDDADINAELRAHAQAGKMEVMRELGLLQGLHPDIALEVKTCQAIRSVLNVMRDGVKTLMEEGGIDEPEGLLFMKVIESKMKWLKSAPPRLKIPSTRKILASIPWIDKNMNVVDYIQTVGQRIVFQYNDRIVNIDDPFNGIHVIISGLVRVVCPVTPNNKTNMQTLDYLSTGNVVGEISELTRRPRMATLICETTVKTLYMSTESLETMFLFFSDLNPPLKTRLWQVCAMRVAVNVLSKVSNYQSLPKELLLSRLEGMRVKHMTTKTIEITKDMSDVVLITGEAMDCNSNETYTAPCFIPPKVKCLEFPLLDQPGAVNPTISFTVGDLVTHSSRVHAMSVMDPTLAHDDTFKSDLLEDLQI